MNNKKTNVRIKLNPPRNNMIKGFYLLITHGDTLSDKLYKFIINKKLLIL